MFLSPEIPITVADVARHFQLRETTTRKLLAAADIRPVDHNPQRYAWADIWQLEGAAYVSAELAAEFQKPLLKPAEVVFLHFKHLSPRTITDRAKKGRLPGILLGGDWRFRERDMRAAAIHG